MTDTAFVIRAETLDGSKVLGAVRNRDWEEGNVYGIDDLTARLARVPDRPDLRISWRAADSELWLRVETYGDNRAIRHIWTCPVCTGRVVSHSSNPQFALKMLAKYSPPNRHTHQDEAKLLPPGLLQDISDLRHAARQHDADPDRQE